MQSKAESNNVEQVWGTEEQDPSLQRGRGRPAGRLKQHLWKRAQLQELTAFPPKAQSVHKANTPDKTLQGYTTNCPPNLGKPFHFFLPVVQLSQYFPNFWYLYITFIIFLYYWYDTRITIPLFLSKSG